MGDMIDTKESVPKKIEENEKGLQYWTEIAIKKILSKHPRAKQILCLIRCSATGLTEFEIKQIIGAGKSISIIDELQWSQMRKALLKFAVMENCGKMILQNSMIKEIIDKNMLRFSREKFRKYVKRLVDYFSNSSSTISWSFRQAEELPCAILKLKESTFGSNITSTGFGNNGNSMKNKTRPLENLERFLFSNYSAFIGYWFTNTRKSELYAYIKELDCKFSQILQYLLCSFDQTFSIPPLQTSPPQTPDHETNNNITPKSKPQLNGNLTTGSYQETRLFEESKELPHITPNGVSTLKRNNTLAKRKITVIDNVAFAMSLSISSAPLPNTTIPLHTPTTSPRSQTMTTKRQWIDYLRYENLELDDISNISNEIGKERGQTILYELRTRGVLALIQLAAFCAESGHLREAQNIAESAALTCAGTKTWEDLELAISCKS